MQRVSSYGINRDIQYNLRTQESKLSKANNQMASQQKIQNLRDDPLAAGHLVRYQSYLGRIERFEKNAQTLTDQFSLSEGYINQSMQVMQRVRELAVTGANGVYSKDDMKNIAVEVNELLEELVQTANAQGPDGTSLFAGTRTNVQAFTVEKSTVPESGDQLITSVLYKGSIDPNKIEVDENAYIDFEKSGNKVFWAEHQQIFASRDASSFSVLEDGVISVDGKDISITKGDNVYAVISKINNSGAAVKASLDPVTRALDLRTTDARQLWLHDKTGTVLSELGVIKSDGQQPPYNISESAKVSGGSMFDAVIALRDALLSGDHESIGGRVLGTIDQSMNNLTVNLADIGSKYERAKISLEKTGKSAIDTAQMIAREGDLDFSKAITDLKMMEYVQQASLSAAGKMYSNTLLNYIK